MNIIQKFKNKKLFIPLSLITGAFISSKLIYSSSYNKKRVYRRNTQKGKINYEFYIKKSFERLGLSLETTDWEKIALHNKQIEMLFKYHISIIQQISIIKAKLNKNADQNISQKEKDFLKNNETADSLFYSLLHKYSLYLIKEKKTVVA